MKKLLALVLFLLVGVALYYFVSGRQSAAKVVTYKTAPIVTGNVTAKVTATGSLQAVTKISVGSEVSGRIIRLYADFNSRVKKGELLAELDPATFQAQLEQQQASLSDAQAAYDSAQANIQNLQTSIDRGEAGILSAKAQIEAARASLANSRSGVVTAQANEERQRVAMKNSQLQLGRQENLVNRDLVARSDTDTARATFLQDQASLASLQSQTEAARASYRSAEATLQARQADLVTATSTRDGARAQALAAAAQARSAAAKVRNAQASLRQSEINLSRTMLRAPIDGVVLDRKVTIGQTVAAQFQAPDLFTLAQNLEQMQVEVAVDEADIGQVKRGAKASFTVDAFPGQSFEGDVFEVRQAPINTQNVITYTVIVRTSNPQLKLMPGMTATVAIETGTATNVMLVANAALRFNPPASELAPQPSPTEDDKEKWKGKGKGKEGRRRGGGVSRLFTLDPATKKLVQHRVRTGLTDGVNTEIKSRDLKAGDEIVTEASVPGVTPSPASGSGAKGRSGRLF